MRMIKVLFMAAIITVLSAAVSFAAFTQVDISGICNIGHMDVFDRSESQGHAYSSYGFYQWFSLGTVTLEGVPFKLAQNGYDALSGSLGGTETFSIPAAPVQAIYLLGSADGLAAKGYCDSINDFSIEVIYTDGTSEETLPVNLMSGLSRWYDYQYTSYRSASYGTTPTYYPNPLALTSGGLYVYGIYPTKPTLVKELIFSDNSRTADFAIFAVTLSDTIPSSQMVFKSRMVKRSHNADLVIPTTPPTLTPNGSFTLVDISPYCNQSIQSCIDEGYGIGRGGVFGITTTLANGTTTLDGIPFKTTATGNNVISGSLKGLETFSVPIGTKADKIYIMAALYLDRDSGSNAELTADTVDSPDYFYVEVEYEAPVNKDMTPNSGIDRIFPKSVETGEYKIYKLTADKPFQAYKIEPLQDKVIKCIRICDRMDDGDIAVAGITLYTGVSDFSEPPMIRTKQVPDIVSIAPRAYRDPDSLTIENAYLRFRITGLSKQSIGQFTLYSKYTNTNLLSGTDPNLFAVCTGNVFTPTKYMSSDFKVLSFTNSQTSSLATATLLLAPKDGAPFQMSLVFSLDSSQELRMHHVITHKSSTSVDYHLFPFLTNINFGNLDDMSYYYPQPRGLIDNKPVFIRKPYGGSATYFQFMDVFNPVIGTGVYMRSDDTWGQGKDFGLSKSGTPLVNEDTSYMPGTPVKLTSGCEMHIEYWSRTLGLNQQSKFPDTIIGVHNGDWHTAFFMNRSWIEKNLPVNDSPDWLLKSFSLAGCHIEGLHVGHKYKFSLDKNLDIFEPAFFWNEPLYPYLGGTKEYYYRDDFGGVSALKAAVDEAHQNGTKVIYYIEGLLFPGHFHMGDWGKVNANDNYISINGSIQTGSMCPGAPGWQDFVAQTAARLIQDTGADGLYLDSIGQCPAGYCNAPNHNHDMTYGSTWAHDTAVLFKKVRAAMRAVKPDAVLYSEAIGSDIALAEMDGGFDYYIDYVTPGRNGKLTTIGLNRFLFPKKKTWGLITFAYNQPAVKKAFFYGECLGVMLNIGVGKTSLSPYRVPMDPYSMKLRQIEVDNWEVFSSKESIPWIQSERDQVYVNKWVNGNQVLYTIFNNNYYTVRGPIVEIGDAAAGYQELVYNSNIKVVMQGGRYLLYAEIGPKDIICVKKLTTNSTIGVFAPDGLIRPGWNLISLPVQPVDGTPNNVLAGIDLSNASLQTWDNASQTGGGYLVYNRNWYGPMKQGEAYWLVGSSPASFIYDGGPIDDTTPRTITVPPHFNAPVWILLGFPFHQKIACNNINFTVGSSTLGWTDAVNAGWIESIAQGWDALTQNYFNAGPASNPSVIRSYLEPWLGYWLLVKTKEQMEITIPTSPVVA